MSYVRNKPLKKKEYAEKSRKRERMVALIPSKREDEIEAMKISKREY